MLLANEIIHAATDRFYGGLYGEKEGGYAMRKALVPHLQRAIERHGISAEHVGLDEAEAYPHAVCMALYEQGVTAIEIVAACALAEQDYLRSKGND